ncbi:MAG: hypothetical protein COB24_04890 [Hyphomicrobiales bacterium]|nr:MAG: hypothetical protein COB24_04890 [Hyphomicrobiales bacterium]
MSDKLTNPSTGDRNVFASGRPDRIKSALQSNKNTSVTAVKAKPRVRPNQLTKQTSLYSRNDQPNKIARPKAKDNVGSIQTDQRARIGAGPKRKASDDLSEILSRQKNANNDANARTNEGVKRFNMLTNSANDDIAHAAQLLEEIKSDSNKKPIIAALSFTLLWVVLCVTVSLGLFNSGLLDADAVVLTSLPALLSIAAILFIPCVLSWGVAVFLYRARELHQISLSLAYTALHLTQPENMASDSIATIGQAVRREVAAMGDGIDRAINRATTLESKFRNEVGNIQGFYKNNENIFAKIIRNLEKERDLMAATGGDLEIRLPKILDGLKESSFDFSKIVQTADERFSSLAATADERLTQLGNSIEDKNKVLKAGLDSSIENVTKAVTILDSGTSSLSSVTDKLANVGNVAASKLENISGNFKRQTKDLSFATSAILKANEEINLALQSRHEGLSGAAEQLLGNAEQVNNLLTSFASVMDKSFLNAENRSQNIRSMLHDAAKESANMLQAEMSNIRKSTSNETQKLVELLKESSFTATTTLRGDIKSIISGSQAEVQNALSLLHEQSRSMADNLKNEAVAITELMHREMQLMKNSAVGNTEQSLMQIRHSHETAIADIIGRIELAGEKLSETAQNLNVVTGRMDTEMENTRHSLAETVSQIPAEAKRALQDMQVYVDDQVSALSELAKTVGSFSGPVSMPTAAAQTPIAASVTQRQRVEKAAPRAAAVSRPAEPQQRMREQRAPQQRSMQEQRPQEQRQMHYERPVQERPPQERPLQERLQRERTPQERHVERKPRNTAQPAASQNKWAMPDLLSRASSDQSLPPHLQPRGQVPVERPVAVQQRPNLANNGGQRVAPPAPQSELHKVESLNALSLDLAKALDHEAPDLLWARYRNGERNVFTRRLYTLRGQKLFDEVSYKYRNEMVFKRDVDRYIADFEELLTKIYEQDRDSMLIDTYLSSETGKVYLMLAHASGRLD